MEKSWIRKQHGVPVVVRNFREADGQVDVSTGGTDATMTLAEWRDLPLWNGPFWAPGNGHPVTKVMVYQGTKHDMDQNADVLLPRWRTREAFERDASLGIVMLESTGTEIDAALLDSDGKTGLDFDPTEWKPTDPA